MQGTISAPATASWEVTRIAGGKASQVRWKFTDDQGRNWNGLGTVEPAADDKEKFIVTLKLVIRL